MVIAEHQSQLFSGEFQLNDALFVFTSEQGGGERGCRANVLPEATRAAALSRKVTMRLKPPLWREGPGGPIKRGALGSSTAFAAR